MGVISHHIYRPHPYSERIPQGLIIRGQESWGASQNFYYCRQISFLCSVVYASFIMFCFLCILISGAMSYISFINKSINFCGCISLRQPRIKIHFGILQGKSYLIPLLFSKFFSSLFFHSNFRFIFSRNKLKIPFEF